MSMIFDGHNDVLLRLYDAGGVAAVERFEQDTTGHIDLHKARAGNLVGGFFAVYVPSSDLGGDLFKEMLRPAYDIPLPAPVDHATALDIARTQVAILKEMEARGYLKICTTVAGIRSTITAGKMAAILHMEGAEAIDAGLEHLAAFHDAGLRSLGPVWSRPTAFAHGVPFAYPGGPDTGPGLTDAGRALIRACNDMGILIDLAHLNEAGFRDVAQLSDAPLVATHSNAHGICPHTRNLTDAQLAMIAESGGVVGVNYATAMARPDGRMIADTPLSVLVDHVMYLLDHLGEDGVALGSDFDGAVVPEVMGDASGLPLLVKEMAARGIGADLMQKICFENWMSVLDRTWKT